MSLLPVLLAFTGPSLPQEPFVDARNMLPHRVATTANAVATADVDLDGDADVLVATQVGPNLLFRGDGSGLFARDETALPDDEAPTSNLALGDLDGDGDPDAVTFPTAGFASVLRNDAGSFQLAGAPVIVSDDTTNGDLGDLDLDGDLDLIVSSRSGAPVRLYRNVGGLDFVPAPSSAVPQVPSYSFDVDLADLDGDGNLDAYVASFAYDGNSTDYVLVGRNGLRFEDDPIFLPSETARVELADLDGDGDVDAYLASFDGDSLAWNDGSAGFSLAEPVGAPASLDSIAEDFDGDGRIDLLLTAQFDTRILQGVGAGAFVDVTSTALPAQTKFVRAAVADVDGDLDPDVVAFGGSGLTEHLWLNDGGVFGEGQGWAAPSPKAADATDVVSGDLNGDGREDVLTVTANIGTDTGPSARAWLAGDGSLTPAPTAFPASPWKHSKLGALLDADGDGDLDALITRLGDPADLYLNDGAGAFTELDWTPPTALKRALDLGTGDLDGDGDVDVVAANGFWDPTAAVYTNDGTGAMSLALDLGPWTENPLFDVVLLDVEGDGDLDLAFSGGFSRLYANDGSGGFTEIPNALPLGALGDLAAGDVDGDGIVDLAVCDAQGALVLLGDGAGKFTASPGFVDSNVGPDDVRFVDVDGDLDLDLIVQSADTSGGLVAKNVLYRNDGAGTFDAGVEIGDGPFGAYALVDVDRDGDRDVVTSTLAVHVNTFGGQVNRRGVPRIGKPLAIEVFGQPGSPWTLALSAATAEIPVAGFGTLLLDPTKVLVTGTGALGADGFASQSFVVPGAPALVGASVWWQALTGASPTFSNREVTTFTSF